MANFDALLDALRKNVSALKSEMAVYEKHETPNIPPFPRYSISPQMLDLIHIIQNYTKRDMARLVQHARDIIQDDSTPNILDEDIPDYHEDILGDSESTPHGTAQLKTTAPKRKSAPARKASTTVETDVSTQEIAAPASFDAENDADANADEAALNGVPPAPAIPLPTHTQPDATAPNPMRRRAESSLFTHMWLKQAEPALQLGPYLQSKGGTAWDEIKALLDAEISYLSQNAARLNLNTRAIPMISKAENLAKQKRIGEAANLMKKTAAQDIGNQVISFVCSQFHYWRAADGSSSSLPDARETAKYAGIFGDRFEKDKLLHYRYLTIASERHFSTPKTIDFIREHHMLDIERLMGNEGLMAHQCIPLKAFFILSTIPTKFWGNYEIKSIADLTRKVPGGALIYMAIFRSMILKELEKKNAPYEMFISLEKDLAKTHMLYQNIVSRIADVHSIAIDQFGPWLVSHRFVRTVLALGTTPTFDEVLLYISLDGRRATQNSAIDELAVQRNLVSFSYWRMWATFVAYDDDVRRAETIPLKHISSATHIFEQMNQILSLLQKEELHHIPEHFADIQNHFPKVSYDNLLEISTRNANPRQMFNSHDFNLNPYVKKWSAAPEPQDFASNLIVRRAKMGGFVNLDEAVAALDGLRKYLIDPERGLPRRLEIAEKKLKKRHFEGLKTGEGGMLGVLRYHITSFWWFYFGLVPLAIMTFIAVSASRNYTEAIQTFLLLVGSFFLAMFIISLLLRHKNDP